MVFVKFPKILILGSYQDFCWKMLFTQNQNFLWKCVSFDKLCQENFSDVGWKLGFGTYLRCWILSFKSLFFLIWNRYLHMNSHITHKCPNHCFAINQSLFALVLFTERRKAPIEKILESLGKKMRHWPNIWILSQCRMKQYTKISYVFC